jgi:hypothetical protein
MRSTGGVDGFSKYTSKSKLRQRREDWQQLFGIILPATDFVFALETLKGPAGA